MRLLIQCIAQILSSLSAHIPRDSTVCLGLLFLMGCSPAIKTCSLSGEVFVDGHPAEGVYVVFHKVDSMSNPSTDATASARTDDKGFYVTQAAQPGQYKVTLFWPRLIVGQEETIEGEDRFQSRYRDLQKPTMSIDVVPGENILPLIKLSSH